MTNTKPLAITNQQALLNLYTASRQAPLSAELHELVKRSAEQLEDFIKVAIVPPTVQSPADLGAAPIPFPTASPQK